MHTATEAPCRGLGRQGTRLTHRPTSPAHLDCCLVHAEKIQCYVTGERRRPRRHDRGHIVRTDLYPGLVATFRCVPHRFSLKVGGMGARFGAFGRHRPPRHTRACGPPECVRACCALVHIISTTNRTGATTPGRRRTSKSGRRASETGCFGGTCKFLVFHYKCARSATISRILVHWSRATRETRPRRAPFPPPVV